MASNSSSPATPPQGEDRQTHTTHTINLPYRSAAADGNSSSNGAGSSSSPQQQKQKPHSNPQCQYHSNLHPHKEPAKITPIPRINTPPATVASSNPSSSSYQSPSSTPPPPAAPQPTEQQQPSPPPTPAQLAEGLEGKWVDEFGNILDWDGTVLGRVEGDLPSMVGRPVSGTGEILDTDGDVVGHVSENYAQQEQQQQQQAPQLHQLDGGLRVDGSGNIYDGKGQVIGKLNEPPAQKESQQQQKQQQQQRPGSQHPCSCVEPDRAAAAAPNPSEIYLDVKSTYEGIQIILKIPTVFNKDLHEPRREADDVKKEEE